MKGGGCGKLKPLTYSPINQKKGGGCCGKLKPLTYNPINQTAGNFIENIINNIGLNLLPNQSGGNILGNLKNNKIIKNLEKGVNKAVDDIKLQQTKPEAIALKKQLNTLTKNLVDISKTGVNNSKKFLQKQVNNNMILQLNNVCKNLESNNNVKTIKKLAIDLDIDPNLTKSEICVKITDLIADGIEDKLNNNK